MSGEEITPIENNGNYWLSKSNTAYHIINPNATSLKLIESDGYYSLARGGDTFYVLDASGNSIKLNLNGRTMFDDFTGVLSQTGSTYTYTPTHVEESPFVWYYQDKIKEPYITPPDAAFLVLASRNDVTPNWDNDSFVNYNIWGFFFDKTGAYHAQTDNVPHPVFFPINGLVHQRTGSQYESLFGFDPDGNGITPGASPTDLLDISGNQHHIDDGHGGKSTILKKYDVTIDPNSNGGLSATQVIANASGGYDLLWTDPTGNRYDVWQVDTSGNFVSSTKAKLWEDEEKFSVDLDEHGVKIKVDINGDDVSGLVEIEDNGDVHLKHGDNTYNGAPQYYIVDGIKDPIGLTRGDAPKGPKSGWSATQVEESGDGYEVFWSHVKGKFEVWKVDDSGSYQSHVTAHLWQHENTFEVDLNGDLTIGLRTIETIGDVDLAYGDNKYSGDNKYYIVDGIKDPIGLTRGDAPKGPKSGWSATQVEESGDGYEVFWSHVKGKFEVWKVDDSGSYQSHVTAHLWQHENTFEVDLNGDLTIGLRTIETIGDVDLAYGDNKYSGDNKYYIVDGIKDPIGLTRGDAPKGPKSGWSATQVEESGDGYEVFWSHVKGKFEVWKVDDSGSYQSHVTAHLWQHENTFEVDLNGDLTIGLRTIETIGDVDLAYE